MRTFEARYPGTCAGCPEPIEPGELLAYDEDRNVQHADCLAAPDPAWSKPVAICPSCFMTVAVNGECSC